VTGNDEQGKVTGILISPDHGTITEPAAAAGVKSQVQNAENVCTAAKQDNTGTVLPPGELQYTAWAKKQAANFCPYLCQILSDFQNFCTGTFCEKFVIK